VLVTINNIEQIYGKCGNDHSQHEITVYSNKF